MTPLYGATLTLGGTISIGNYENVKVELSGAIRDEADLEALITGLQSALVRLGREDDQVGAAVDSFIRRVFGTDQQQGPGEAIAPAVDPTPGPAPQKATAKPEPARTPLSKGIPPAAGKPAPAIQGPLGSPCNRTDCDRYIGCNRVSETCPLLGRDTTPAPEQVGRAAPEEVDPNAGLGKFAKQTTTKDPHVPSSSSAPAAAPPKADAKPAPKSGGSGKVCSACGAEMTNAEAKTSILFASKLLCKPCLETGGKESQASQQPGTDEQIEALKAEAQRHRDAQDAHAARAAEASRA